MTSKFDDVISYTDEQTRHILKNIAPAVKRDIQEIRFRFNRPVILVAGKYRRYVQKSSLLTDTLMPDLLMTGKIAGIFERLCDYSVYTHQDGINNGFITLRGGHRAGICGTAVLTDGRISNIKNISSINIRIAHQVTGCAGEIHKIYCSAGGSMFIAGRPVSGKTTILRDMVRLLSYQKQKVAVVDERNELAAVYASEPQNDLGPSCDVLCEYPKAIGIMQAVRTLSPDVIVFDEIGSVDEAEAVKTALTSGVRVITTVHAGSRGDLASNGIVDILRSTGQFKSIVLLDNGDRPGQIKEVFYESSRIDSDSSSRLFSRLVQVGGAEEPAVGALRL